MLTLVSCSSKVHKASGESMNLADGINTFGLGIYSELHGIKEGNLFFSPLSVSQALSMTQAGARGATMEEMAKVLNTGTDPDHTAEAYTKLNASLLKEEGTVKIMLANALWPQEKYKFLPEYFELVQKKYNAGLGYIDYGNPEKREAGRKEINEWVSEKTGGNIENLVPADALSASTRFVLTNAIYFMGVWKEAFNPQLSTELPFRLNKEENTIAYFMSRKDDAPYFANEDVRILELPYDGDRLVMDILLPQKVGMLENLEEKLTPDNLNSWLGAMEVKPVQTLIPRWRSETSIEMGKPLMGMGMRSPFSTSADFSGMTGRKGLFISRVIHKAFIEVTEKGTEAAAATAVTMKETVAEPNTKEVFFRADHPFIYLIRDRQSGVILFMGRLMVPTL